ncbi:vanin-like protein 2 isoform X2 [Homalodisca vitripennis]|nr:vanin-like protein 2 isoform X2 [Homalodisca vitripennis]XP_046688648.1 vanin-like protein 2 isoform X2 [Homalodisca vitripennis]
MVVMCRYSSVLLAVICLQLAVKSGLSYTAAVVEFAPTQSDHGPADTLLDNARRYIDIIKTAATHNANIVVFPECGLTTIKIPVVRQDIFPFLIELPEVGTNPCDLVDSHQVLQLLSCAAKHNAIYVVVNLSELAHCSVGETDCPPDGSLFYNTNIAFNKSGHIVARYRKTNLFIEPEFSIMKIPDYSWFDTDFGVRFGIFTCFDILFKEPTATLLREQNITDFVYPTAWFSELPFYSAISVQAGWAYANDVNLLAAGYNNPKNKNTGSGIYEGRDGEAVAHMSRDTTTRLLISTVNTKQRGTPLSHSEKITITGVNFQEHKLDIDFFHYNLENFTSTVISGPDTNLEYYNEGFRCKISVQVSITGDGPTYRLVAWSGLRTYAGDKTAYVEFCGVIACPDTQLSSCGYEPNFLSHHVQFSQISIRSVSKKSLFSYPITLTDGLLSFPAKLFSFTSEKRIEEFLTNLTSNEHIFQLYYFCYRSSVD